MTPDGVDMHQAEPEATYTPECNRIDRGRAMDGRPSGSRTHPGSHGENTGAWPNT